MKSDKKLVIGFFVLVFVLMIYLIYFQYQLNAKIDVLEAENEELRNEVADAKSQLSVLGGQTSKLNTDLLELNNQLNARLSMVEEKIS
ncbi:hypothetical protein KY306_02415 [Candidatus Woesearchaeota archaeon]|nr:hypothetical protein [Candidatus Woesearchaeota archaeon]